jgi:hypothetical protein
MPRGARLDAPGTLHPKVTDHKGDITDIQYDTLGRKKNMTDKEKR